MSNNPIVAFPKHRANLVPRRGQSVEARRARLDECRCPVHGLTMGQIGWYYATAVAFVGCPRRDCGIMATAPHPWGPATLTGAFAYLLEGGAE